MAPVLSGPPGSAEAVVHRAASPLSVASVSHPEPRFRSKSELVVECRAEWGLVRRGSMERLLRPAWLRVERVSVAGEVRAASVERRTILGREL